MSIEIDNPGLDDVVTPLSHGAAFIPRLSKLRQAFALARKCSIEASSKDDRRQFRRLAELIWQSCGGGK